MFAKKKFFFTKGNKKTIIEKKKVPIILSWNVKIVDFLIFHFYEYFIQSDTCTIVIEECLLNAREHVFKEILFFLERCLCNGILLTKLFWTNVRKNCSIDQEKLLQILSLQPRISKKPSLDQFFLTLVQNNFGNH